MKKFSFTRNLIAGVLLFTCSFSYSLNDPKIINAENVQMVSDNSVSHEEVLHSDASLTDEIFLKSTKSDPCIPDVPYIIPVIPKNNYTRHIYIDPSRSTNGNGTISNPYNTFNGLTIQTNTSYYLKRGTSLAERVRKIFVHNYITSYGEGAMPIIEQGFVLMDGSRDVVFDGLDIRKTTSEPHGTNSIMLSEGTSMLNIYITNNIIQGVYSKTPSGIDLLGSPIHYPTRGIRFSNSNNFVIYNNIIRNIHDDGIWIASTPDLKIVRNWVYEINKGGYDEANKVWHNVGGDCIQLEYGYKNLYMAGNILDKSNTTWKFSFIINSGWDNTNRNIIIEYNTFVGSRAGNGGAVVYLNAPEQTIFRYNVLDGTNKGRHTGGVVPLSSSHSRIEQHLKQNAPYGILNNHLIKKSSNFTYPNFDQYIDKSNVLHQNYSDYTKFLSNNPGKTWGSDIDTEDFWKHMNCNSDGYLIEFDVKNSLGINVTNATITFAGKTNPQGIYQFPNTKAGTYSYSITANGYQTFNVSNLQISKNAQVPVQLVAIPPATYSVNFNITNGSGTAISNAIVTFAGKTNPQGNYQFTNITAGTYSYTITANGYQTRNVSNLQISQNTQVPVQMVANPPATYSVNFNITNSSGTAISNAIVTFDGKTNPQGNYQFTNITAGTYSYTITANGYQTRNVSNLQISQNTQVPVQMVANPPATYSVNFNITNSSGAAISNATVTFDGKTNPQGNYVFNNIANGSYGYAISAPGFQRIEKNVSINQNTLIAETMSLEPITPGYTVSFKVFSSLDQQTVIENAIITFNNKTNDPGNYTFHNIPQGIYPLAILASGYKSFSDVLSTQAMNITVPVYLSPEEQERIRISAISDPPGFAFITGAGEYPLLEAVNIEASAVEKDFEFVGWTENGKLVSKDASYRFTASKNREITARFEYAPQLFDIDVLLEDIKSGLAIGPGRYKKGEMANIQFQTNREYIFKGWANSSGQIVSRQNPYNFEVLRNTSLTAVVEKNEVISDSPISVFPNPSNGILYIHNKYNDTVNLKVLNSQGIVIESRTVLSDTATIDLRGLPPGLFILHFEYETEVTIKKILFK
jgi:hypothetical protein